MSSSQNQAHSTHSEMVVAFDEWLKEQEAQGSTVSVHPAARGIVKDRLSVGRRLFRTAACGFITIAIVGGVLAWPSGDDETKDVSGALGIALNQLSSILRSKSSASFDLSTKPVSKSSKPAPTQQTVVQQAAAASIPSRATAVAAAGSVAQPRPPSAALELPPELQHKLETMAGDLAAVRRIVEQLAARQEQMAGDIAALQTTEQNISQKLSSLPRSSPSAVGLRKKRSRIRHTETLLRPSSAPVPPHPAAEPLRLH
jgi:hypothetical protein